MRASSSSSITPVTAGMSSCLASLERHPDQLDQFGIGTGHALDAVGDRARVGGEEAGVEAARPPGGVMARPMNCSAPRSGRTLGLGEGGSRRRRGLCAASCADAEQQAGLLEGLADRRERERARLARRSGAAAASSAAPRRGIERRATGMRRSAGSTRPPGNTNLPGMNLCRA